MELEHSSELGILWHVHALKLGKFKSFFFFLSELIFFITRIFTGNKQKKRRHLLYWYEDGEKQILQYLLDAVDGFQRAFKRSFNRSLVVGFRSWKRKACLSSPSGDYRGTHLHSSGKIVFSSTPKFVFENSYSQWLPFTHRL